MDAESDIPEQWNHIATLRPQLHKHITAHPHNFRGVRWYILSDAAKGRHLRFNEVAYEFIGRLDGDQTIEEIYQQISLKLKDDSPNRQELLSILVQLFSIGLLRSKMPVDVEQLFKQYQTEKSSNRTKKLLNPLAIRFPLFDPDKFLNRSITAVKPVFSVAGTIIWCLTVLIAAMLLLINYQDLVATTKADILQPTLSLIHI